MKIEANAIIYPDHKVVLKLALHKAMPDYIHEMAATLSPTGDSDCHRQELEDMNNDGSWTIKTLPVGKTKAFVAFPSPSFYQWELADSDYCFPMTESQVRAYKYKTSKATSIRAGDEVKLTGNIPENATQPVVVNAIVWGFYAHQGNDSRMMLCLAEDGYILIDLITQGHQITLL